jgi:heptosyltransferase-2
VIMKKIVVIQTAFLGDLLLSIPLFKQIKNIWPDSEVTLVCKKGLGEIFLRLKLCEKVVEVDKKDSENYQKDIQTLSNEDYDLLLCPHQSSRSAILAKKIKAKTKVGFKEFWNFLIFNKRVQRNMLFPDALRQLSLLTFFSDAVKKDLDTYLAQRPDKIQLDDLLHRYKIPDTQSMGIKRRILSHPDTQKVMQKFRIIPHAVFISPGSVWNTKKWTKEGFRELATKIALLKPVVLIGSADERELCTEIAQGLQNVTNLAGQTTLFELLALLTYASVLISNDSGSMHMASVAETPAVAIFGPTVLDLGYQPWNNMSLVVENKTLDCRPCGKHGHEKCPIGTHECMKSIGADVIISAIQGLRITL